MAEEGEEVTEEVEGSAVTLAFALCLSAVIADQMQSSGLCTNDQDSQMTCCVHNIM